LTALNDLNSFKQALNTKCLTLKTESGDSISTLNKSALNKNEKMHVLENEDVLLKNSSTCENIGGAFLQKCLKAQ
jgi:hypothetical protein